VAKHPTKLDALGRRTPPNVPPLPKRLLATSKQGWASRAMRDAAATDYITDADGHDVRWHHERKDRLYSQTVGWKAFEVWSINEKWKERRRRWWEQIEERVRLHYGDRVLRARLDDMARFEQLLTSFDGYLMPLKDKAGKVVINEATGLPAFALDMPSFDKFMVMYLKLHERVMLLRGEATQRTESTTTAPVDAHQRPMLAPNISQADIHAMARTLLEQRMLLSAPGAVVETAGETIAPTEEGSHDAVPDSKPRGGNGHKGNGSAGP